MKIWELDRISEIVKGTLFLSKEEDIGPENLRELGKFHANVCVGGGGRGIDFAYCLQSSTFKAIFKKLSIGEKVKLQQ